MVSVRWVAPILLFVVALPAFGAKKPSSSQPPRELHRVGDHSTAYNPPDPATYPAGAKTYTIKRGDTLWTLAQQFYNNAYLWPQLWEANTWITDAHWIYPGDVLLVEGEVGERVAANAGGAAAGGSGLTGGPTSAAQQPATGGRGLEQAATGAAGRAPIPLGTEADVYCYGYLGDPREPMPNSIAGYEDVELRYAVGEVHQNMGGVQGDFVYINGGTQTGIVAGETYLIVEPAEMVTHPVTHATIGQHYDYRGQVQIIRADERRSCGIIVQNCAEIHPGNRLKPLPQIPIPLARVPLLPAECEGVTKGKAAGYIVNAQGGWSDTLGEGLLVEIDLGRDDQLQPGDFLTVWRPSLNPENPNQVLGELGVLTTEAHTATAVVVGMRYAMRVGDHVEAR